MWEMVVWDHEATGFAELVRAERVVRWLEHETGIAHVTAVEVGNDFFHLVVSDAPLDEAWGHTYRAALDRSEVHGIDVPPDFVPEGTRHPVNARFFGPLTQLYAAQAGRQVADVFDLRPWT